MALTISPNESAIMSALRAYLLTLVTCEVIQGQDNLVAEPIGQDFIVMTPMSQHRVGTNRRTLDSATQIISITCSLQYVVQLDIHGPGASDNSSIVALTFFDEYSVENFAASSATITPLFASEPRQMPFRNAEQMSEDRYIMEVNIQADQTVVVPQQSATAVTVGVYNVDYPPTP